MLHKIINKLFNFTINLIQSTRIVLIFLCFFVILYWLLQIWGYTFTGPIFVFFEGIKNITHIFYTRTVQIDKVTVDFSFLIATITILLFVWLLNILAEYIKVVESQYNKAHEFVRKKTEDLFNKELHQEYLKHELKNNKALIIINFLAENSQTDKFYHRNTGEGVEEQQKKILDDFYETLEGNFEAKCEFTGGNLLLNLPKVEDIDKQLASLEKIIYATIDKYKSLGWKVDYLAAIDVYASSQEIDSKITVLSKMLSLQQKNKLLCLATFKERYLLNKQFNYKLEDIGNYKIIENEEVFWLRS